MNKKGITLIELIIFIIIGGMFIPLAYIAFTSAVSNSMKPETAAMVRVIAETKMNDINNATYDNMVLSASFPGYLNISDDTRFQRTPPNPFDDYRWKWEVANAAYTKASGNITFKTVANWTDGWVAGRAYNVGDYIREGNLFYRVYFPPWETAKNYRIGDYVRVSDGTYYRRLPSDVWTTGTPYILGNYVHPTSTDQVFYKLSALAQCYYYMSPAVCSVGNCSFITEPGWPSSGAVNESATCDPFYSGTRTWVQDTTGYNDLLTGTVPSGSTFSDGELRWLRTAPSLITGSSVNFVLYTGTGIEFNDGGVRWKESTVYKQVKVYVLPPGCNSGQPCEYVLTAITSERNYTNRP